MALTIGDTAPDFEADTTEGRISFHDWIGDSWAVLFSHPKDFTPVCTTELGYMASIKPEFDRRDVKIIGLSVDPTGTHEGWVRDIEETQGHAPNYPIIGDSDFTISKLYGMLGADVSGDPGDRTAADNQTVRNVFVDRPRQEDQAGPRLPDDDGAQLRRGAPRDRLAPADRRPQGLDAGQLAARGGRDHRRLGLERPGDARSGRTAGRSPSRTSASSPRLRPAWATAPPRSSGLRPRPGAPAGPGAALVSVSVRHSRHLAHR